MRNASPPWNTRRTPRALLALFTLLSVTSLASACGDDGGIARVDRSALAVSVGGSGVTDFVSFPVVPPGQNRDAEQGAIEISNAGSGTLKVTNITTEFDSTGYITVRGGSLPEVPFELTGETRRSITLRLSIPAPSESEESIACPAPPADLPSTIDSSLYCGRIDIFSDAPEENTATIYVLVRQSDGRISVTPDVLTFQAPVIGQRTSQDFTITNESTSGELRLINIALTDFTGDSSQFSIDGFGWPTNIRPGEQLVYTVNFTPESVDELTGKIEIESDDPSAAKTIVSVQVTSSSTPQIAVSPDSLLFPEAAPGAPQTQDLTITNEGTAAPLTVTQMAIRPAEAAAAYTVLWDDPATPEMDYVAWQNGASQAVIPRSNSRVIQVRYTPPEDGTSISGTLRITSNATNVPNGAVEVSLSGNSASPNGYIAPSTIIYNVAPGESETRNFTIGNRGLAPLTIDSLTVDGPTIMASDFTLDPDPVGMSVAPGELLAVELTHNRPAQGSAAIGNLSFATNNPFGDGALSVNVQNSNSENAIAPVARISQDPDGGVTVGTAITFDGTESTPESGEISYYLWTLLERPADSSADLSEETGEVVALTPDTPGTYRVQLVVGNSLSLEGAAVREVIVME